ncbi:diacylglycerol/lipid kinase family protein [Hoyosella subflava]|uniref:Diacylglycerol kinase, catalytic region n=1 Tax=Hoyosella subflava (strain DSM 45089 / JCM 17490 / NBRC 109087 / DQS3-9A1) TaxID=443218 RepID=F6EIY7_HOYSD|nr:diacylglycerol kinase family protein [Hoyosella subflava]AEF40048.1 Diacylglycerol kinase, catalytic region [Hoyosella subflava DQS3-9A1]
MLVNPASGGGSAIEAVKPVAERLRDAGANVTVTYSTGKARSREMIPDSVSRGEVIVAVGGDGMVGSLAGAVAKTGGTLGIVPTGRGNDFARQLGLPKDPEGVARVLLDGKPQPVDIIEAAGETVVGSVYAGVDSLASALVDRAQWLPRPLQYPYAAVRALATFPPQRYVVTVDGNRSRFTGCTVVVANSGFYGSGMHVAPRADPTDGLLDVVMIAASSRIRLIAAMPTVYKGTHLGRPEVIWVRGKEVTIECEGSVDAYGDGDWLAPLPVTATVREHALQVMR